MAFNDQNEYPRGRQYKEFFTGQTMDFPSGSVKMSSFQLDSADGPSALIFRRPSAGAEYFRFPIAFNKRYSVPCPVDFADGLEIALAANGDVTLLVTYYSA